MLGSKDRFRLQQNIIDLTESRSRVLRVAASALSEEHLRVFLEHPLGVSPGYSQAGKLIAIAVAIDTYGLIIEFSGSSGSSSPDDTPTGARLLQDMLLCRAGWGIYAFDLAPLAMSLYLDVRGTRITNGVDIQSAFPPETSRDPNARQPLATVQRALGADYKILTSNVTKIFEDLTYYQTNDLAAQNSLEDLFFRAWLSNFIARVDPTQDFLYKVPRIDTLKLTEMHLDFIAKAAHDTFRLDQMKPQQVSHDFVASQDAETGQFKAISLSYKNKIQRSDRPVRIVINNEYGAKYVLPGQAGSVVGRSGTINTRGELLGKTVGSITTLGRDNPTTAEASRAQTLLRILQGSLDLLSDNPWFQNIFFSTESSWPDDYVQDPLTKSSFPPDFDLVPLNTSQIQAIDELLSYTNHHHITLIHGPPGTGKTSVIAAFVHLAIQDGQSGIWLVAQSNVAVKNIAEKLAAIGFLDWKLLVSKDFHYDWHEHLYTEIHKNIIRSDEFAKFRYKDPFKVVLCTLSMLSNNHIQKFTSKVPVKTLIIDEASQIEVGDYIPVLTKFSGSLRKLCFIGDDKQLPPYGQEDLQDLQSIFEITHLRDQALFLDTQYRMPPQIGHFISDAVYNGKLHSNPKHPITDNIQACFFINAGGNEKFENTSYLNPTEIAIVLKVAQHLQDQGKSYRIITPYDAQRNAIESEMKATEGLDWNDKCFNVDSFQGNEDDYIIISLVRSRALGFLKDLRRTNVMLTRFKRGMFIVSSQAFLQGVGAKSLAGELLAKQGEKAWLSNTDVENGGFFK